MSYATILPVKERLPLKVIEPMDVAELLKLKSERDLKERAMGTEGSSCK